MAEQAGQNGGPSFDNVVILKRKQFQMHKTLPLDGIFSHKVNKKSKAKIVATFNFKSRMLLTQENLLKRWTFRQKFAPRCVQLVRELEKRRFVKNDKNLHHKAQIQQLNYS